MNDFYLQCPAAQVTQAERRFIKEMAEWVSQMFAGIPRQYVNIGVLWGCTMHCLRAGDSNATLIGIDVEKNVFSSLERPELLLPEKTLFMLGDSTKIHKAFIKPIHLLLVDGDHNYDTVKKDILGWAPKVVPGGVIIFHDYAPTELNLRQFPHIRGVKKAVDRWEKNGWKQLTKAIPHSLFVMQKRSK